jgi:hypothetical protein
MYSRTLRLQMHVGNFSSKHELLINLTKQVRAYSVPEGGMAD